MVRLWPFVVGSVALGLDAYVIAGLLPSVAESLGSTTALAGLGVAAFTGAYAIAGPLLAGRAGRDAARGLATALAVFTVGNVMTSLSSSIGVFIAARVVAGAAAGVYSPLSSAVAAASVESQRRGRALSLVLAGLATGTVLGVPAGLLLAGRWGWRAAIWLITTVGVLALAGVVAQGRTGGQGRGLPSVAAPGPGERLRVMGQRSTMLTIGVTFLTGAGSLGLYTYVSSLLVGSTLAGHEQTAIWLWGLGGAVGAFGVGRLVDRVASTLHLTATLVGALAVTYTAIAIGPPAPVLGVALVAWGLLGWASLAPQQHTLLTAAHDTGSGDGATSVAANASANYLGAAAGSLAGSALIAHDVHGSNLAWAALPPTIAALALQVLRMRQPTY